MTATISCITNLQCNKTEVSKRNPYSDDGIKCNKCLEVKNFIESDVIAMFTEWMETEENASTCWFGKNCEHEMNLTYGDMKNDALDAVESLLMRRIEYLESLVDMFQ